jgi:hypothetical protein
MMVECPSGCIAGGGRSRTYSRPCPKHVASFPRHLRGELSGSDWETVRPPAPRSCALRLSGCTPRNLHCSSRLWVPRTCPVRDHPSWRGARRAGRVSAFRPRRQDHVMAHDEYGRSCRDVNLLSHSDTDWQGQRKPWPPRPQLAAATSSAGSLAPVRRSRS